MMIRIFAILVVGFLISAVDGQTKSPKELETEGITAMREGRYLDAAEVFTQCIEANPKSFVGYYNLASALSRGGQPEGSAQAMGNAIALGFSDKGQLLRDPDLEVLRETAFFASLMESWSDVIEARRGNDLAHISQLIKRKKQTRTHERYKIELVSAHGAVGTDQALAEMDRLAQWAIDKLFPSQGDEGYVDDLPWIMVALPDKRGFLQWAVTVFGPEVRSAIGSVGGAYEHQNRRLVAQDLGATFRHEFIHVLHWRDMNEHQQVHAPWVQEGLASLVEDYDMVDGVVVPVLSWRTNIVKRLFDVHKLPTIREMASMPMDQFTSNRPLAKYAQARTMMLYLLANEKLGVFYQGYLESYNEDRTGIAALEQAMGMELDEIEEDYRAWVGALATVPETGSDLDATLGIGIENGDGDGVVVTSLSSVARRRTGLHVGEVIWSINGRATRDLFEFIRVLGSYEAGETVVLSTRRGAKHHERSVELRAR